MLQYGANLLDGDARKPFNELGYECTVLEILEERRDGYSGAAEYPSATHAFGIPFNGRTCGPIDHHLHSTTATERRANAWFIISKAQLDRLADM
jgi:hypothetical protein